EAPICHRGLGHQMVSCQGMERLEEPGPGRLLLRHSKLGGQLLSGLRIHLFYQSQGVCWLTVTHDQLLHLAPTYTKTEAGQIASIDFGRQSLPPIPCCAIEHFTSQSIGGSFHLPQYRLNLNQARLSKCHLENVHLEHPAFKATRL